MSGVGDQRAVTLLELLDRMLDRGVVLTGDLTLSVADVDLIRVGLHVVLASVERIKGLEAPRGRVELLRDEGDPA